MDNQKKEFNRMKHHLEKWRELILLLHSVLKWEQTYFPAIIVGVVSLGFLFLWYMDLTFVTCTALLGLTITLFDYFYPKIAKMIFKPENWRGVEEKKFEEVAEEIFHLKNRLQRFWVFVANAKSEKSTLFILAVSTVCVILAWIGSTINNQILAFLTILGVLLYPGCREKGYFDLLERFLACRFNIGDSTGNAAAAGGGMKKEN